jgi:hypothetical protein
VNIAGHPCRKQVTSPDQAIYTKCLDSNKANLRINELSQCHQPIPGSLPLLLLYNNLYSVNT